MNTRAEIARASAETALGVRPNASYDEIRNAWKKRAFELHPDRGVGTNDDFSLINNAYSLLKNIAEAPANDSIVSQAYTQAAPAKGNIRPRPAARVRVMTLSDDALQACEEILSDGNTSKQNHVPTSMRQTGRRISYRVDLPLAAGENRVAVPTGALVDGRKVLPTIVSIHAPAEGPMIFEVPADVLNAHFPGARSVHIHFANCDW